MRTKQLIEKNVNGTPVYEGSGDFEGTLTIVPTDQLFAKITDVMKDCDETVERLIREASQTTFVDSLNIIYCDDTKSTVFSHVDNVTYVTDRNGVLYIKKWIIIVRALENIDNAVNLLIYNPSKSVDESRIVTFSKDKFVKVDIFVNGSGKNTFEINIYDKNPPKEEEPDEVAENAIDRSKITDVEIVEPAKE